MAPFVVSTVAVIVLLLASGILAGGAVIAVRASKRAPDGFEDEEGFHLGRMPPRPRS